MIEGKQNYSGCLDVEVEVLTANYQRKQLGMRLTEDSGYIWSS